MSKLSTIGANLYHGHVSYDFVGKRKLWYSLSGVILLVGGDGREVRQRVGVALVLFGLVALSLLPDFGRLGRDIWHLLREEVVRP